MNPFLGVPVRILILLLALMVSGAAAAGTVYRWTDAKGVTHYSDSKPLRGARFEVKGDYKLSKPSAVTVTAEPQPENKRCEDAQKGVGALEQTGVPVRMDLDGDGIPEPMDDETRARQLDLARAQVKAFCTL